MPPSGPRYAAVIVHGLGDHGQALPYRWLSEALDRPDEGILQAVEHRGARRLAEVQESVRAAAIQVRAGYPTLPLIGIGLSMGAMATVLAAQSHAGLFDGIVAAAAPLGPVKAGRAALLAARLLGRVLPGVPIETGIDPTAITDNSAALAEYTADPLFRTKTRLGLAADLLAAMPALREAALGLGIPALFLHGQRDRIAPWDPELGAALARRPGCTVRLFPDGYHNLFLDQGRAEVFGTIREWAAQARSSLITSP